MSIRIQMLLRSTFTFAFSTALAIACGDDSGEGDEEHGGAEPQVCKDISSVCHDLDNGSGMAHECHETAHDGDAAACETIHDACIAFCTAGTGTDTGSEGGSSSVTASESSTATAETGSSGSDSGSDGTTAGHDESTGSSGGHDSGSSDTGATSCDVLGSGCHDVETPEAQACHDIGHDGDVKACDAALAECTEICGL